MKKNKFTAGYLLLILMFLFVTPVMSYATSYPVDFTFVEEAGPGIYTAEYDYSTELLSGYLNVSGVSGSSSSTGQMTFIAATNTFTLSGSINSGSVGYSLTGSYTYVTYVGVDTPYYKVNLVVSEASVQANPEFMTYYGYSGTSLTGSIDVYLDSKTGIANVTSAKLTLNAPAVPVPAAGWLLGSGLVGLVGLRRKIRK